MSTLLLAVFLVAGFVVGRVARLPQGFIKTTGMAVTVILFLLIFLLGLKLGGDRSIIFQFGSIGAGSLVLGVSCTLGSVLFAGSYALIRAFRRRKDN
jgi:uncharacterized membrane protein YbjE (DUF340 family)